jgi:hypothetical protein
VLNALNQPEFFSDAEIKFFEKWLKEKEHQKQIKKLEKKICLVTGTTAFDTTTLQLKQQ